MTTVGEALAQRHRPHGPAGDVLSGVKELAATGGAGASEWIERFSTLGAKLRIRAS